MSDGKQLDPSLNILKRHYPQVASLQEYIYCILSNATEVSLAEPGDPEEYRDLLEKSKVGYHQLLCQKYRARASIFEIDEVGGYYAQILYSTYKRPGHQEVTVVPSPSSGFRKKYHYRWLQGTHDGMF
jgi:hypothetical protein